MKRNAQEDLSKWYRKKDRMPLILRGARQVGKSTLVRLFCESKQLNLIEVNIEKRKLKSVETEGFDLSETLDEIQLLTKKRLTSSSLVFIDEIQEQPKLIQMLRYFYEEAPSVAVIAAGSLLEIAMKEGNFSFPVGRVEFLNLGPMTFLEFLSACNEDILVKKIEQLDFSPSVHELATKYLKKYFYVGGMPKSVLEYIETKSIVNCREIQEQVIQTYIADFPKYKKRVDGDRLSKVFNSSAYHVGRKAIYQHLDPDAKSRETRRTIELLVDARVLLPCYHSNGSQVPLGATIDEKLFKLYFIDVGLLNCIHRLDYDTLENEIANQFATKGMIAEQFVAQHLWQFEGLKPLPHLNFWLRDKDSQKGEIDFLIESHGEILPVEVKAHQGGRLKSLFYFSYEKKWKQAIKLSLSPFAEKEIKHKFEDRTVSIRLKELPLYAVEALKNILDSK